MPLYKMKAREICMTFYEINNIYFPKEYCYNENVIVYALYAERGKVIMKSTNEASKIVGVSKRTLQYYDDEGVVLVKRSENNYRLYDQDAFDKIWKIMLYKEMGFELKDIKTILSNSDKVSKEYMRLKAEQIKIQMKNLEQILGFILSALENGLPSKPEENSGVTYIERIKQIKEDIK